MKLKKLIKKRKADMEQKKSKLLADEIFQEFENLKDSYKTLTEKEIKKEIKILESQKNMAEKLGQEYLFKECDTMLKNKNKEMELIKKNVTQVISFSQIQSLDKVGQKVLALCDLNMYPREIPAKNAQDILEVKDFFDNIIILYTDYTEESENIVKEKDPIAFGIFNKPQNSSSFMSPKPYDRVYVITDWIDEYCDLTFEKLVKELSLQEQ